MGSFEVLEITIRRPEKKNIFMRLSTSHFLWIAYFSCVRNWKQLLIYKRASGLTQGC